MVIFDPTKIIKSCLVGSLVKAAPTTSANSQDALLGQKGPKVLAGLDDMGSVQNLREVVAASIAGKIINCVCQLRRRISLLPI